MVPGSALRAWWRWDLLQVCEVQWQRAGPRGQRRQQTRTQTRGPRVPRRSLLSSSVDERKLRESGGRGCWNVSAATQNVPYVQEHTHLHTHTHTCTHTCIHKHTHAYMHTCTHMHMHTHTHTRSRTHAHAPPNLVDGGRKERACGRLVRIDESQGKLRQRPRGQMKVNTQGLC